MVEDPLSRGGHTHTIYTCSSTPSDFNALFMSHIGPRCLRIPPRRKKTKWSRRNHDEVHVDHDVSLYNMGGGLKRLGSGPRILGHSLGYLLAHWVTRSSGMQIPSVPKIKVDLVPPVGFWKGNQFPTKTGAGYHSESTFPGCSCFPVHSMAIRRPCARRGL